MNNFEEQLLRLKQAVKLTADQDVAALLGVTKAAFSDRKKRGSFPEDKLWALAKKRPELDLDTHYVLNGVTAKSAASQMLSNFGSRLREVRGEQPLDAFAQRIGVTPADLIALEEGHRTPTTDEVLRLQQAHPKHSVNWLLGGDAPTLAIPPSDLEVILLTNYRNSSAEGQEAMRRLAAFYGGNTASNPEPKLKTRKPKAPK